MARSILTGGSGSDVSEKQASNLLIWQNGKIWGYRLNSPIGSKKVVLCGLAESGKRCKKWTKTVMPVPNFGTGTSALGHPWARVF